MRAHPAFADRDIPARHPLGGVVLKALGVEDEARDYAAVIESADEIRAAFPHKAWPQGLTREENLIDLAWHQRDFRLRRSFAWVIEDPDGGYLGCAYVNPTLSWEYWAEVWWWWRTGAAVDRAAFRADFLAWLAGPGWPALDYRCAVPPGY